MPQQKAALICAALRAPEHVSVSSKLPGTFCQPVL